ncbi:hypothetical protein [Candidatus Palauibacter sp.]|uniref:hypothetical protein n=1 Tax=Candidatus Palauibacter sp. TaxID=3101350 RepID=UPI003B02E89C
MTTGYGDGRVTIGSTMVGRVAVTNVATVPALTPRIRFGLSWTLGHLVHTREGNRRDEYQLVDFGGELRLGPDDRFVGQLVRDGAAYPLRSFDYVDTQGGSVALDLGRYRLEQLEECRAGGVLIMKMQLWPRVEIGGVTTDARVEEIRFRIPRDDWLEVVRTATGEQVDVLEIRYHLMYADRYDTSLSELRRARDAVDRGDFNGAVMQARKAVSLMEGAVRKASGDQLKAVLTDRIDEEHADLYGGIVARAKGMGNINAHRPAAREYTRVEALFAIRLATISLEVVAGLLAA